MQPTELPTDLSKMRRTRWGTLTKLRPEIEEFLRKAASYKQIAQTLNHKYGINIHESGVGAYVRRNGLSRLHPDFFEL